MSSSPSTIIEAEVFLREFLGKCSSKDGIGERVRCPVCSASRALYCPDCCEIVVPEEKWPATIRERSLRLPFNVDIFLDDRRASSTGVHAVTIANKACHNSDDCPEMRLLDVETSAVPQSYPSDEKTFFLFPGTDSVPLSSVLKTTPIDRLVVLDCKWTKTSSRTLGILQNLQRVYLDRSFQQSYYWRWHTAGEGMISTIEAIYVSAWEVATWLNWDKTMRERLVCLLWLFGLQRDLIQRRYQIDGGETRPSVLPFTEDGKQYQRNLRSRRDRKG